MKEIRAIFSDLDGTLLNDQKEISEETISAIKKLREKGYLFGLATGRPIPGIVNHWDKWKISDIADFVIGLSGAVVWDLKLKHVKKGAMLQPAVLIQIYHLFSKMDVIFHVYDEHRLYVNRMGISVKKGAKLNDTEVVICDMNKIVSHAQYKIGVDVPPERLSEAKDILQKYEGKLFHAAMMSGNYIEITAINVTKIESIRKLAKEHGFSIENVMAFGDSANDVEMLQEVGWGVCMKNGIEEIHSFCNDITEYNNQENGVSKYLEKYFC